jgi:ADP-ribosylglycohydrolase
MKRTASNSRRHDRIAGALLGVHAGDSLGATLEFMSWQAIRARYPDGLRDIVGGGPFGWPAGYATDDTDLTRAVLLAYLTPGHADVVHAAADNMLAWLDGDWPGRAPGSQPRDIGNATRQGLERYRRCDDPRAAGAGRGQAGNGSLMRCIPTALAVTDRTRRIRESIEISAITHDDQRATAACAAYNEIAAALVRETPPPGQAIAAGLAAAHELGSTAVADAIDHGCRIQPATLGTTGTIPLDDNASGYVLDSLSLAVAAILDPRPLSEVLIDIVRIGNDTDTNAAIAGGLLGARDGASAIPVRWRELLQFADEFTEAAAVLADRTA